ncbi:MAG: permease, partial [Acidobacteria bacterium]|nr:permease [Acidobacteriota bacterium]
MRQDLRFALRRILKTPGFTGLVLLTLGLGIGANTAIFSLMDQVLLRLLPVRNPEELVVLDAPGPFSGASHNYSATLTPISHPMFEALRDKNTVFDGLLAHCPAQVHLTANGET